MNRRVVSAVVDAPATYVLMVAQATEKLLFLSVAPPTRYTRKQSSAASDVYKQQHPDRGREDDSDCVGEPRGFAVRSRIAGAAGSRSLAPLTDLQRDAAQGLAIRPQAGPHPILQTQHSHQSAL